ncbi:retinol dehydrogenase 13 [Nematostella vectensis]|uniref:retinol dehydrogenase 13 n=1 Tax=Nematostella vectensis TaxID=45351 RepID=UPI0020771EA3|nr:retinol dehydrogenase 13 [Nematostella vectensis]
MAASRNVVIVAVLAIAVYFIREHCQGRVCKSEARLDGKTVIITGATTGIGKETAVDLAKRGARVIIGARNLDRGNAAVRDIQARSGSQQVFVEHLDLASLSSVRKFAEVINKKEERVDILMNNAGVAWIPFKRTEDGFEMMFGVNHLSHFLLTNLLLDKLKRSAPSRIINVSSKAHLFTSEIDFVDWNDESKYSMLSRYANSKLANVLFARELAKRLKDTGVTTYSLHPGTIMTDLGRDIPGGKFIKVFLWPIQKVFFKSLEHGAQTQICCAVSEEHANETGLYYDDCQVAEPSKAAQDDEAAKKLWDLSAKLVSL